MPPSILAKTFGRLAPDLATIPGMVGISHRMDSQLSFSCLKSHVQRHPDGILGARCACE